jgi:hypothetical protein
VHPAILLAVLAATLVARLEWRGNAAGWLLGPAGVAALLFLASRLSFTADAQQGSGSSPGAKADAVVLALWGAPIGLGSVVTARLLDAAPMKAAVIVAVLVAASAHAAGAWRFFELHYVGGAAALLGLEAFVTTPGLFPLALAGAAAAYFVAGRAWRLNAKADPHCWPLDDVSLGASVLAGLMNASAMQAPPSQNLGPMVFIAQSALAALVVLAARAVLDRSRLVSTLAAAMAGSVYTVTGGRSGAGGAALALAALAICRGQPEGSVAGRKLLGLFRLPFGASGRRLWGDAFATAALLFSALMVLRGVFFLMAISEAERPMVVLGSTCVLGVALIAFFTRGLGAYGARGHFATWCSAGGAVVLVALANRLGRPLPPQVVGLRFTLIVPALWAFALLMRRYGPWLAKKLENESQGPLYHWLPHAGVAALGLLCLAEGSLVGSSDPTVFLVTAPPLLFAAGALAALLLGRSFGVWWLTATGLAVLIVAAACAGAQQSLTGPQLAQLAGRGAWLRTVPAPPGVLVWENAARGVAALAFAYAVLAALAAFPSPRAFIARLALGRDTLLDPPVTQKLLAAWSERAAFGVFAAALFQPRLPAAALVACSGLLLRLAGERAASGRVGLFGFAAFHAALAIASGTVPMWAGPLAALTGVAVILIRVLRGTDDDERLLRAHFAATALGVAGLTWALATGGAADRSFALPSVLSASGWGLWSAWPQTWSVPAAMGCLAATQLIAGRSWRGALRRWTLAGAVVAVALGLTAATAVGLEATVHATALGGWVWAPLVVQEGGPLALALCGAVVAGHLAGRDEGFGLGRDLTGALLGSLLALFVATGARSQLGFATAAAALATVFIVEVMAALQTKTGRHAWAAQVAVVGAYALVQAQWRDLEPALDAVFGLGFAFVLVGVTVVARRAGVAPLARATRVFAALLPVVVALVFPSSASRDTAMLAAASSLLYAVLATVEHNRVFGALAASRRTSRCLR